MTGTTTLVRSPEISDKRGSSQPWLAWKRDTRERQRAPDGRRAKSALPPCGRPGRRGRLPRPTWRRPSGHGSGPRAGAVGWSWRGPEVSRRGRRVDPGGRLGGKQKLSADGRWRTKEGDPPFSEASSTRTTSLRSSAGDLFTTEWTVLRSVERASLLKTTTTEARGRVRG